jgi:hypothetical protein
LFNSQDFWWGYIWKLLHAHCQIMVPVWHSVPCVKIYFPMMLHW